jgi:hypothetical protein
MTARLLLLGGFALCCLCIYRELKVLLGGRPAALAVLPTEAD